MRLIRTRRLVFFFALASLARAEQCQITSPLPVPVLLTGCTYSGSLPSNSTSYIQNTLSPTTTTQAFSVQQGTFTDSASLGYLAGTQCLHTVNGSILGTGAECGSGGGGGGGYFVEPATVTFNLAKGFTASTGSITGAAGASVTYGLTAGSVTVNDLTASRYVVTDTNKKLASQTGVPATDLTGVVPAANLNGANIPGGSTSYVQLTSSLQTGATFYVSSGSVSGQLTIGTQQGAGLTNCGDSTHASAWSGGVWSCQEITVPAGTGDNLGNGTGSFGVATTTAGFTGAGGVSVTYGLTAGSVTVNDLTASLPTQTDSNKKLISLAVDLSGAQATGTMAAGREPAHTGDVTNSAGSLAMTMAPNQANMRVVTSSLNITGTGGLGVTFGVVASSVAVSSATVNGQLVTTGITINELTASRPMLSDANKKASSGQIDFANTNHVTGTMAAAQEPAHSGDVTNSAGSLAMTAATNQGNIKVFTSSITFQNVLGSSTTWGVYAGTVTVGSLSASLPTQTDANKMLVSAAIDLSGSQATGTMAAARMPALTGDITTSAGAVATTLAGTIAGQHTWTGTTTKTSSMTVTAPLGVGVTFGITASSIAVTSGTVNGQLTASTLQGAGLTTCGDASHGLSWSGGAFGCQSITGTAGGVLSSDTPTWTGVHNWANTQRSSFTVAPALLNLTNTILATDANGVIISTTVTAGGGSVTPSSVDTFTNKTIDAEATGNSITIPFAINYRAGLCQAGTASLGFSYYTSSGPTATCVQSSSTIMGVASFVYSSTNTVQDHFRLPSDFTGNIDLQLVWFSTMAVAGQVAWESRTACISSGTVVSPTFNAYDSFPSVGSGAVNRINEISKTALTITGCTANSEFYFEIARNGTHPQLDTYKTGAYLVSALFTMRRAL